MKTPLLLLALFLFATSARADFTWTDTPGKHLELTYGDKPVELRRGLYRTEHHHYRNELN